MHPENRPQRQIHPPESRVTRLVRNEPDGPSVVIENLPQLKLHFPIGTRPGTNQNYKSGSALMADARGEFVGTALTPSIKKPLVPGRLIDVGGGRAILGGTSKEALRRAKRKLRTKSNNESDLSPE